MHSVLLPGAPRSSSKVRLCWEYKVTWTSSCLHTHSSLFQLATYKYKVQLVELHTGDVLLFFNWLCCEVSARNVSRSAQIFCFYIYIAFKRPTHTFRGEACISSLVATAQKSSRSTHLRVKCLEHFFTSGSLNTSQCFSVNKTRSVKECFHSESVVRLHTFSLITVTHRTWNMGLMINNW